MKYSTGKEAGLRHATGSSWTEVERMKKKRNSRVRYSTGRDSRALHFTGTMTGYEPPDEEEADAHAQAPTDEQNRRAEQDLPWASVDVRRALDRAQSADEPARDRA